MQLAVLEIDLKLTQERQAGPSREKPKLLFELPKRTWMQPGFGQLAVFWMLVVSQCADGKLGTEK